MRFTTCLIAIFALLLITGCRRQGSGTGITPLADTTLPPAACASVLFGIPALASQSDPYYNTALAVDSVNKQNGAPGMLLPFGKGSVYANQGTIMDGTYTILLPLQWIGGKAPATTLRYGIPGGSAFTDIALPGCYVALAANQTSHIYYCVIYGMDGIDTLTSFGIAGNAVTAQLNLGTFSHSWVSPPALTVDEPHNTVYIAGSDAAGGTGTVIYKHRPGSSVVLVSSVAAGGEYLIGMQYNSSDGLLYAVSCYRNNASAQDLIRINPQTGVRSLVTTLPDEINNEFYSTAIDPCSNRMYISGKNLLTTIDLSSGRFVNYHLPYFFQGLAIR